MFLTSSNTCPIRIMSFVLVQTKMSWSGLLTVQYSR